MTDSSPTRSVRIIMSVINDLAGDQRIHRIASCLQAAGYEVLVIGRRLPDSKPLSKRPYRTARMKLWFHRGKWFYLEYNLRLFWKLLWLRVDILNANDLDTLLANFMAAKLKRKPLVYDSHEYFTEVPELIERPSTRTIWLRLEKWLFPRMDQVYTVNDSLARIYRDLYKLPVQVVRNVPTRKVISPPQPKERILLYQGSVNLGRGIDLMIKAMRYLPEYQLWIIGKGDVWDEMDQLVKDLDLASRVKLKGFVPFEELAAITIQAMLGFSLEEDRGLNYRYASPNKVYDYIQAGVPAMVSDLPEMRATIQTYQVGMILADSEREPAQLAQKVRLICEDPTKYQVFVKACQLAANQLNWEKEQEQLLTIYRNILPPTPDS